LSVISYYIIVQICNHAPLKGSESSRDCLSKKFCFCWIWWALFMFLLNQRTLYLLNVRNFIYVFVESMTLLLL